MSQVRIAFDMNDGQSPRKVWMRDQASVIGELPEPTISVPGMVFIGWYTKPKSGEGVRFTKHDVVDRPLTLYAHWSNPRNVHSVETLKQDKWVNDTKNQISLLPGSEGYEDYLEDIQEHDDELAPDMMHQELAEYNEDLASALAEKAFEEANPDKQKRIRIQQKQAIAGEVFDAARKKASKTRSTLDDAIVEKLERSGSLIYDDSILPDKLDDAVDGLAFGE